MLAPTLLVRPPCLLPAAFPHRRVFLFVSPDPFLQIDYGGVNNARFTQMPAHDFITMMQDPLFLGDPNIVSQHLLGLSKWQKLSATEIVSQHQSRAAHIRYEEGQKGEKVAAKGHGHGRVEMRYLLVEGDSSSREGKKMWKWAGIKTKVHFNEHEFEKVFLGSAGKV